MEINGLHFREIPPEKRKQLFNIPSAFNGSKLKGLKKTVVFFTVLTKGKNVVSLIPKGSAFIEDIKIQEFGKGQEIALGVNEQAEDGDRRPWYTFVLVDLPLKTFSTDVSVKWRFRDSDDVKLIIDNEIKKNNLSIFHKNWLWSANIFKKLSRRERQKKTFNKNLGKGIHYIEFYADRMPIFHQAFLKLTYRETDVEIRAGNIIKEHASLIKQVVREFKVDPVMVGTVIYQEQATNVNFIDTLTDYSRRVEESWF